LRVQVPQLLHFSMIPLLDGQRIEHSTLVLPCPFSLY
jgi:hypothetical protein